MFRFRKSVIMLLNRCYRKFWCTFFMSADLETVRFEGLEYILISIKFLETRFFSFKLQSALRLMTFINTKLHYT